jgi:hypothetical protein
LCSDSGVNPTKLFSSQKKDFFRFLLLSLSVCSMRKYCVYFEMAKLKSKNKKNEKNQSLVGLTPGLQIVKTAEKYQGSKNGCPHFKNYWLFPVIFVFILCLCFAKTRHDKSSLFFHVL